MRTVGVEEELLVVSRSDHRPIAVGSSVVAGVDEVHQSRVELEFKAEQAELGSAPAVGIERVGTHLRQLRHELMQSALEQDAEVVAIATSPFKVRPTPSDGDRYARMTEQFGLLARQQLTCGQHVHVFIESREEGVAVLDRLRPWLHVLTAISTNSPFWQGQDSGYASYRTLMWGLWPTAGPTDAFGNEAGYDLAVDELLASGAAMDAGMLYFDARLSAHYPTVEIRVADVCTDVDDALVIAALARALVQTAAEDWRAGRPAPTASVRLLRAAAWRAARTGLSGDLVDVLGVQAVPAWKVVDDLLAYVGPVLQAAGDAARVADGLCRIRESGTGAEWQRRAFDRRGRLEDVVAEAAARTVPA
jgi:glutamate---cysteine ligase / carboxylate-amine ligase